MNQRNLLSTLLLSATLFAALPVTAAELRFYQKASQAAAEVSGNVAMRLTIAPDGSTNNVRITRSSGSEQIDAAAIRWMENETMSPVHINGEAAAFSIVKEIPFSGGLTVSMK